VLKKQAYGTHEALHAWYHDSPRCQLLRARLGNNLCDKRLMGSRSQVGGVLAVADLHGSALMQHMRTCLSDCAGAPALKDKVCAPP